MKKTNILKMSAHPVYLDEPVADESELAISQRCKSAEQVPPMTHCCTLPDHRALRKHTKNLQTSSADLIGSELMSAENFVPVLYLERSR